MHTGSSISFQFPTMDHARRISLQYKNSVAQGENLSVYIPESQCPYTRITQRNYFVSVYVHKHVGVCNYSNLTILLVL